MLRVFLLLTKKIEREKINTQKSGNTELYHSTSKVLSQR